MNSTQFLTALQTLVSRKAAEKGVQDGDPLQLADLFDESLVATILEEQRQIAAAEAARIAAEAEIAAAALRAEQAALSAPNLTGLTA